MNPRDFLALAETLISGAKPDPPTCRTVIGRSYYAAYNVVAALIAELSIPLEKGKDSHKEVVDLVAESKDASLKAACDSLARQKMVRRRADYEMDDNEVEKPLKASQALIFAKQTVAMVDRVRTNPDSWTEAKANMVAYAKLTRKLS
jgi:hypothetical protein